MTEETSFRNRIVFLGTGTSSGIPVIGCQCPACTSTDPRDRRTRTSALLQTRKKGEEWQHVLIDSGIDLRFQLLREGAPLVRHVVYTHAHVDHFFGLDELRAVQFVTRLPIHLYVSEEVEHSLRTVYRHLFQEDVQKGGGILEVRVHRIARERFCAGPLELEPLPVYHGNLPIFGFRFGDLVYLTDCSKIPEPTWPLLENTDTLVLGMLRKRPHPTHFNLEQALEVVEKVCPRRTYFVHMTHDLVHAEVEAELPEGVQLAYDGLSVDLSGFDPCHWSRA